MALAALALVVFGAIECPPKKNISRICICYGRKTFGCNFVASKARNSPLIKEVITRYLSDEDHAVHTTAA